ncbi:type II toxin-antitoxin system ParD family antitoxin [Terrarubrum flagellatum]|uniref:type II toxin-antitoxin system ParD family antitoxin n=1 Tax=Terrirubrum flagellatum TaxID=2895980 RepID=UPI0031454922
MPSSYSLGKYNDDWIKRQVASGRYNNASEVIRDALRHLQDREMTRSWTLEEIREAVRLSDESGPGVPADKVWAIVDADLDEIDRADAPKAAE